MTSYSGPAGGGGEGGGAGRDATERDGLNTPPRLPDEPAWMAQHPSAGDGEDGAGGRVLGWRGGRRSVETAGRASAGGSRAGVII